MAHNSRIRQDPYWVAGPVWKTSEAQALDTALSKALNGDGGGTWNPTANIVIGGAGLQLAWAAHQMSGSGSYVGAASPLASIITFGDNDYDVLGTGHPAKSRIITCGLVGAGLWPMGWQTQGLGPVSMSTAGVNFWARLHVHNGAVLASAAFGFKVASHASVPAVLPSFRLIAVDVNGGITPLVTNGAQGFVPFSPIPISGTAWYNTGSPQSFTYTCDAPANNPAVTIDTSKWMYFAEVVDESGTGAAVGNSYDDVTLTFSSIADMRPQ